MINQMPEGNGCYSLKVFAESTTCPDLDDSNREAPKCRKYDELLTWNRSGLVLKCKKCLEENDQRVPA